jgi:hypothetical protein
LDRNMRAELKRQLANLAPRFANGDACCRDLAIGRGASESSPLTDDSVARIMAGFRARVDEERRGGAGPVDSDPPISIECPEPIVEPYRPPPKAHPPAITLDEQDPPTQGPVRYLSRGPMSRDRDRHGSPEGSSSPNDSDRGDRAEISRWDGRDPGHSSRR